MKVVILKYGHDKSSVSESVILKTGKDKKREGRLHLILYAFYAIYFVFTYGLSLMPLEF